MTKEAILKEYKLHAMHLIHLSEDLAADGQADLASDLKQAAYIIKILVGKIDFDAMKEGK